ncbi:MAG: ABC transporter ATP-binding protein [Alphaproteobacteria bacterium]|nr:ABC transporter ATP-binding protein [Alphaproteobacteria bacterium]
MIEVENLRIAHDGRAVVDGVSFKVEGGACLGLVGESGSGKSTILRALAGLNREWSGAMRLDGAALGPVRTPGFHRRVQMVFQEPLAALHPRQNVARQLAEPRLIQRLEPRDPVPALAEVGLGPELLGRYPHQISGGQRQRVCIARALMLDPEVLLLDEPTAALDAVVERHVLDLLARLRTERGLTMILVSHSLKTVRRMAGRVAVLDGGRIVETPTVADLDAARHPVTRRMVEAAIGYRRAA